MALGHLMATAGPLFFAGIRLAIDRCEVNHGWGDSRLQRAFGRRGRFLVSSTSRRCQGQPPTSVLTDPSFRCKVRYSQDVGQRRFGLGHSGEECSLP